MTVVVTGGAKAWGQEKGDVQVAVGLGYVSPSDDHPGTGGGGFGRIQYSLPQLNWLHFYTGGLWANTDQGSCGELVQACKISAHMFMLGAKVRLSAPIPYVQPYVDFGLGMSIGDMTIQSGPLVSSRDAGVMPHVPFALGLEFGKTYKLDLGILLMFHPTADGVAGGFGIGLGFAL